MPDHGCTFETPLIAGAPGSPGHLLASDINPAGASELAALMRTMVSDWQKTRAALGAASMAPLHPAHAKMRCAWPTDPSDRTASFDAMAQVYLTQVRAFDDAPTPQRYDAVISACASCHENTCPGPLEVIEGLKRDPHIPL